MTLSRRTRLLMLGGIAAAGVVTIFLFPPVPQDSSYHNFADQRGWAGIPNAWNVLSNLPFLVVGVMGIRDLLAGAQDEARLVFVSARERWAYAIMFLGVALTAFGSAYYHGSPNNTTLVWDRIPMAIAFMGLFSAVIAERVEVRTGCILLGPLVAAGIASVVYWHWTELQGRGDLRPYIVAQYLSILILLLLLLLFPPRYSRGGDFVVAVAIYALAKVFELTDAFFFSFGRIVSGLALKHLAAAAALAWLLRMLRTRHPVAETSGKPSFD